MAFSFKAVKSIVQDTFKEFSEDRVTRLAAALSYYTVFSLPPLLVLIIAIVGFVYGDQAAQAQDRIMTEIQNLVGTKGAEAIQTMIENASRPGSGSVLATVLGLVTLIIGATGAFIQLQDALNTAWGVELSKSGVKSMLLKRVLSFGMIVGVGFLLLVSLVVTALLSAFSDYLRSLLPVPGLVNVFTILNFLISLGVITTLFAAIFKVMPDAKITWRDVWVGAGVTALLFVLGKTLIGFYLGRSDPGSAYGAAGSLAILLVWIYYSATIVLLGAEFTQVYARTYGTRIVPEEGAVFVVQEKKTFDANEMPPAHHHKHARRAAVDTDGDDQPASKHAWRR